MIPGFRPMLFPNDPIKIEDISGDYLMSTKLDGIRCIFIDGQMVSRRMKPIRNIVLQHKYEHMKLLSKSLDIIFDGELWGPYNFPEISGYVMSMNKWVPDDLKFHCFEALDPNNRWAKATDRCGLYMKHLMYMPHVERVNQYYVNGAEEIADIYIEYLDQGLEGAILKHVEGTYKFGRITTNSKMGYKLKPMLTFEAIVEGVEQAFMAKPDSQRTIDAFGKSHTSGKQEDRVPIQKAASFLITYNGFPSKVSLAMTDTEKEHVWNNQCDYVGRKIEFKGMLIGSKDRVRHPVFLRFRDDL